MKYDIDRIKSMRLEGKTLKEIGEYYGVKKSTISKFLKRHNITFGKLPKKCNYCGKIFIPKKSNHKYCCREHYKYHRQEKNAHYFKRKNMNDMSLDRTHSNIAYKESLNSLNNLLYYAEKIGCDDCGEHEFAIAEGNVYCRNCGLVFE